MPAHKGRVEGKKRHKWSPSDKRACLSRQKGQRAVEEGIMLFFPQWVRHPRGGWELSLEDINHGISAFCLYYELDYQIRSLGYTGHNEILMKVDITDGF